MHIEFIYKRRLRRRVELIKPFSDAIVSVSAKGAISMLAWATPRDPCKKNSLAPIARFTARVFQRLFCNPAIALVVTVCRDLNAALIRAFSAHFWGTFPRRVELA